MAKNQSRSVAKRKPWATILIIVVLNTLIFQIASGQNHGELSTDLSDYEIFEGDPQKLNPGKGFVVYELVAGSFTDSAEKKRFIKVPDGQRMIACNDGLPVFPNGTLLVKTFYYFNDKRKPSLGVKLIETRVLLKKTERWIAGTYRWNETGTVALLSTTSDLKIYWNDEVGEQKSIQYHVPSEKQCMQCHQVFDKFLPIGPKISNLNTWVIRNGNEINQLDYLSNLNILDIDRRLLTSMDTKNTQQSIEYQAKAYLDINCGHCHQNGGYCSNSELKLSLASIDNSMITKKAARIEKMMSTGKMPMIGTTILDEAGIALIKKYLDTLK